MTQSERDLLSNLGEVVRLLMARGGLNEADTSHLREQVKDAYKAWAGGDEGRN